MQSDGSANPVSCCLALLAGLSMVLFNLPATASGSLTGNIGVTSKYIFRGGVESDQATVQGGLDYSHPSGLYAGYWGSQLDYTQPAGRGSDAFENDLYVGWSGGDAVSYDVGALYYLYTNADEVTNPVTGSTEDADAADLYGSVGYGPVSLGAAYAVTDASWTDAGDIYWTLSYGTELSRGFSMDAKLGYYTFAEDNGAANDNLPGTESSNFRDFVFTLSHPVGETGADMSLSYVQGGEDRTDADFDNQILLGVTYNFDVPE